jgi:serine/threonine protein kinase
MEYIEGHSFDELKTSGNWGNRPRELLRRVASAWLVTGLRYGIVHGDLHAGNLMVDRDGRVVFLDFGITARLDTQRREMIREALVAAIALGDFGPMARLLCERDGPTSIDLSRVGTELAATLKPALAQPLAEISPGQVLGALVEIGTRTGVKIPRDLIVLAKQLLYFEHYATSMAPQWSLFGDLDLLAALFEATPANESGMPSGDASSKTHIDSPDCQSCGVMSRGLFGPLSKRDADLDVGVRRTLGAVGRVATRSTPSYDGVLEARYMMDCASDGKVVLALIQPLETQSRSQVSGPGPLRVRP